jgi:hypothetical protein
MQILVKYDALDILSLLRFSHVEASTEGVDFVLIRQFQKQPSLASLLRVLFVQEKKISAQRPKSLC